MFLVLLLAAIATGDSKINVDRSSGLDDVRRQFSSSVQRDGLIELLKRRIPLHWRQFEIEVLQGRSEGFVRFETSPTGGVRVAGNSAPDVAYGIQRYLRKCCLAHFSWDGNQLDSLPSTLPVPRHSQQFFSFAKLRYFGNICTYSYSFIWWDWKRWEQFIDWLAFSGFNLVLAPIGQEYIWQEVWRELGLNQSAIDDHFTGPAFLAWSRMGNLRQWTGPLSQSWLTGQMRLQKKIIARMLHLGILPVLPTFAGHVPHQIKQLFPEAAISRSGCWGHFSQPYSCLHFVHPDDPLFQKIAHSFISKQGEVYGLMTHVYSADPFNEMTPMSFEPSYLRSISRAIYSGCSTADPKATWVMQGWMFLNDMWTPERVRSLLSGVPANRLLILDLYSEMQPLYSKLDSYYGRPFIWNMLHNFGGTTEMRGSLQNINTGLAKALAYTNVTMTGAGLTMEGIFQNYIQYQFMIDRMWSNGSIDIKSWIPGFIFSRYGSRNNYVELAWQKLSQSIYNQPKDFLAPEIDANKKHSFYANKKRYYTSSVFKRPHFIENFPVWYNPKDLCSSWKYLLSAAEKFENSTFYKIDAIDVTKEVLHLVAARKIIPKIVSAYRQTDQRNVFSRARQLNTLFSDLENVLNLSEHFSVQKWRRMARNLAKDEIEAEQFDFNARNQLTLWGPGGQVLDYARKQWSGLIVEYYGARWSLFCDELRTALRRHKMFSQKRFNRLVFSRIEKPYGGNPSYTGQLFEKTKAPNKNLAWTDLLISIYQRYYHICLTL